MPLTFVEADPRATRNAPLSVTLSVGETSTAARLSASAHAALAEMTESSVLRLRAARDGNRIALVLNPDGATVSRSGSFASGELEKALGHPKTTVKHALTVAEQKTDGFVGFWLGAVVKPRTAQAA